MVYERVEAFLLLVIDSDCICMSYRRYQQRSKLISSAGRSTRGVVDFSLVVGHGTTIGSWLLESNQALIVIVVLIIAIGLLYI